MQISTLHQAHDLKNVNNESLHAKNREVVEYKKTRVIGEELKQDFRPTSVIHLELV